MTDPTPRPSRLLRLAAVLAPWALGTVLAAWLVVGAAWGALHGWIVPRIDDFRPRLERLASQALGAEVRIGAIGASSNGLLPSFELRDVVLHDAAGQQGLRLARVQAQMSPRALLRRGFEQVVIDGPVLDMRRTADGRLLVAGLDVSTPAEDDGDGRAADWVFAQRELAVRQATVRWTDERLGLSTVELHDADLVIRNGTRSHRIRLDATPPAHWGARFSLRADMRQSLLNPRRGDWREWQGTVYAEFPQADLAVLRGQLDPAWLQQVDVQAGQGLLRAWGDVVHGELLGGQVDLALRDARARLGPDLQPLALQDLQGRLRLRQLAGGLELQTEHLRFVTVDGADWPQGDVFLSFMRGESRVPGQGVLRADRIDLAALAEVAGRLPLPERWRAELQSLAPRGRVDALQVQWSGRIESPSSYHVRGRVRDLVLAAGALPPPGPQHAHPVARPGVLGLSASFELADGGGQAQIELADGALEFPGVFEQPRVPLQQLRARLRWHTEDGRLTLQVPELQFANADAAGQLQARWRSGVGDALGELQMSGQLQRADGTRVHRYLPLAVDQEARHYVRDAVQRGRASSVTFRVEGALDDFPFDQGRAGVFQISADVEDVRYAYVPARLQEQGEPPWPALTGLAGRLLFDRNGMQVRNARGQLEGVAGFALTRAEADIPDFDAPEVAVRAQGRGPLASMLAMVASSPVAAMAEHALDAAQATGAAELALRLALPLQQLQRTRVQGSVQLAGNDVRLRPELPLLARARGAVAFSDQGFQFHEVQAAALGGDLRLQGGLQDGALSVRGEGTATAEGLRQAPELGALARLAGHLDGSTGYGFTLSSPAAGALALTLDSSLQGLASRLPAPLDKPAAASWPLHVALAPQAAGLERITLRVGDVLRAQLERDAQGLRRAALVLGEGAPAGDAPAPLPQAGITADLRVRHLALNAWQAVLDGLGDAAGAAAGREAAALPQRFTLVADTLQWNNHRLHGLALHGGRERGAWQAQVEARELAGQLLYREGRDGQPGSVQARLARLALSAGSEDPVDALLDEQPASVPALDIVVQDFQLRGRPLGRLEVQAVNQDKDWLLHRLVLDLPEAHLSATGRWGARAGQAGRRTSMDLRLDIRDAGALLARLGMAGVFRRGEGHLQGQVAWTGSPLSLDQPSLDGELHIDVRDGQFLKADAGPARLLGVLSLQALPRRLSLDFRDLFSEGFAFDFVRGDARIARGVLSSNNLQMKGVNAAVLMEGSADITRETQQLRVVVVPEINAGTASLVASVINPAVGLGTFLAQWVLRRPLMDAATREFQIDGTWADPRIERVARTPAAAPADALAAETQKGTPP